MSGISRKLIFFVKNIKQRDLNHLPFNALTVHTYDFGKRSNISHHFPSICKVQERSSFLQIFDKNKKVSLKNWLNISENIQINMSANTQRMRTTK